MINDGFIQYDSMCAMCHGAPGLPESVLHQGLYPEPPELYEEDDEWSASELFWLTKNGIKMSGMPAYGPTHSDEEIWAIVAFLQVLPNLTESDYKEYMLKNINADDGHDHVHGTEIEKNMKKLLDNKSVKDKEIYTHEDGGEHEH